MVKKYLSPKYTFCSVPFCEFWNISEKEHFCRQSHIKTADKIRTEYLNYRNDINRRSKAKKNWQDEVKVRLSLSWSLSWNRQYVEVNSEIHTLATLSPGKDLPSITCYRSLSWPTVKKRASFVRAGNRTLYSPQSSKHAELPRSRWKERKNYNVSLGTVFHTEKSKLHKDTCLFLLVCWHATLGAGMNGVYGMTAPNNELQNTGRNEVWRTGNYSPDRPRTSRQTYQMFPPSYEVESSTVLFVCVATALNDENDCS